MAPSKSTKRNATVASMPIMDASPKKQHVDPRFANLLSTLQNADTLNEHCRAMLVVFAKSLSTPRSVRHPAQNTGVAMIEETLQDARTKFASAAALAEKERLHLEGSKETRVARMTAAQASLEEKTAAQSTAQAAFEGAQGAVETARVALATAQELLAQGEEPAALLEKEKASLAIAFQDHFKAPMETGQGPHFNFLEPFTGNLGLEESLIKALPSSCVKTKEQRGGFDDLVIAEFEKALVAKIAALETSIAAEVPAAAARKDSVLSAQSALDSRVADDQKAAAELAAITAVRVEAEEELSKANEDCIALEPSLEQVTRKHISLQAELHEFESGTLAYFEELRDKESPASIEQTAIAGA